MVGSFMVMLKLDEKDRESLKRPLGPVLSEREFIAKVMEGGDGAHQIVIGDVCTKVLLEHGVRPWIAVVDWKSMRVDVGAETRRIIDEFVSSEDRTVYTLANPAGHLNSEALGLARMLVETGDSNRRQQPPSYSPTGEFNRRAMRDAHSTGEGGVILVDGEEDLVALAFISACGSSGPSVFYGQPKEGIVHVKAGSEAKSIADRIIANMAMVQG